MYVLDPQRDPYKYRLLDLAEKSSAQHHNSHAQLHSIAAMVKALCKPPIERLDITFLRNLTGNES